MDTILMPESCQKFYCEKCNFTCSKESNWKIHISTAKHNKSYNGVTNDTIKMPKNAKKCQDSFVCQCGNSYNYRQGLYKHRKKCMTVQSINNQTNTNTITHTNTNTNVEKHDITHKLLELIMSKNQEFITELVSNMTQTNKEMMTKMIEIMPNIGSGNNSNNNNNIYNTQNFNIQMFLNEHCKNAMNLTDFIDSLPITADTYNSTIENGLTKTITNMLVNGLNQLDILDRPIHCTDANRKTLYVKDDNTWEKDNELLYILKGIKTLSMKQRTMLNKWQDANMGWDTKEDLQSRMTRLVFNSMTTIENDDKETGKIIRAISKNVYLDNDTKGKYIQQ